MSFGDDGAAGSRLMAILICVGLAISFFGFGGLAIALWQVPNEFLRLPLRVLAVLHIGVSCAALAVCYTRWVIRMWRGSPAMQAKRYRNMGTNQGA